MSRPLKMVINYKGSRYEIESAPLYGEFKTKLKISKTVREVFTTEDINTGADLKKWALSMIDHAEKRRDY